MVLTAENYYSQEADREYMSVSQFKDFVGSYGRIGCEERALEKLNRTYEEEKTTALLVGSYVDAYFEGPEALNSFKEENPQIFTKTGGLRSEYRRADDIIARCEDDAFFYMCLSGEKQVIMTGTVFGVPWKIKMDSYHPGKVIVDLKIVESITKPKWVRDIGYLDFIRYWGYDIQGAIYQEVVYQNTGERLPFYVAAATKESVTDIAVINVQDNYLKEAMSIVEHNLPRVMDVKTGKAAPERCGSCDYCRKTKVLEGPIGLLDLMKGI